MKSGSLNLLEPSRPVEACNGTALLYVRQHFPSNQKVIAAVEGYFADLTKNHYRDGIMALEHRWNKCISLKGDNVEK